MIEWNPQCLTCKNYIKTEKKTLNSYCKAFPEGEGIPIDILGCANGHNYFDHSKPYPNAENPTDNGIRYEPKE